MPFRGFRHLGGLVAGLTAGGMAVAIPWLNEGTPGLAVGLCMLGALNAYLLALLNRSLSGVLFSVLGGFLLGLASFGALSFGASGAALPLEPEVLPRIYNPLLIASLCPLLGAGPLALAMFFQEHRPRGLVLRLFLGAVGGALAACAGLAVFGLLSSLAEGVPEGVGLVLAFTCADYLLFRWQVLFLLESAGGERAEHPAREPTEGPDDEP